ncbi:hypothetical protein ACIP46_39600 [Streptomyces lavendulae]|uniref:hypothetical protein n=1 Tax=Streptomyces lavendulae TaxID=1914 RepID=UPI0024A22A4C|nr:hypothetical protein [Streptomyces lavendulae]GLW01697.1 hypothetical protein Slala05_53280 [Streptomyces lavendulae subsp. lavendulae]
MPGTAPRLAALLWALLIAFTPAAAAWARPVGTADGPGDVALAIGVTTAAAVATGLWLRSRYRRDDPEDSGAGREDGGPGGGDR